MSQATPLHRHPPVIHQHNDLLRASLRCVAQVTSALDEAGYYVLQAGAGQGAGHIEIEPPREDALHLRGRRKAGEPLSQAHDHATFEVVFGGVRIRWSRSR